MNDNPNRGFIYLYLLYRIASIDFPSDVGRLLPRQSGQRKSCKTRRNYRFHQGPPQRLHFEFNTSINNLATQMFNVIDVYKDGKLSKWEHVIFLICRVGYAKEAPKVTEMELLSTPNSLPAL